jgi:hypothetical protein
MTYTAVGSAALWLAAFVVVFRFLLYQMNEGAHVFIVAAVFLAMLVCLYSMIWGFNDDDDEASEEKERSIAGFVQRRRRRWPY